MSVEQNFRCFPGVCVFLNPAFARCWVKSLIAGMSEKNEEKSTPAAAKRKIGGLGRGLNALIEGSYEKKSERVGLVPHPVNSVGMIPVEHIQANPYQPRTHFDQEALRELA